MISLLQSSSDSHLTHSNNLYTISSMFRLWNIQQLFIRASWFVTRNHEYLVIAKQSLFWANRSCAVQRVFRHTNACMTSMTSMRWLLRRPDKGLGSSKQINEFNSYLLANYVLSRRSYPKSTWIIVANELETQLLMNLPLFWLVRILDHGLKTYNGLQA